MIITGIKSYFACAWSAATYIFNGMPADKASYWSQDCGFADLSAPEYAESVANYAKEPNFHHLKDIMVEWCDAWPQRGAKLSALFGCVLAACGVVAGFLVGVLAAAIAL